MHSLRMTLMSGVAAVSMVAAPALAQQDTAPAVDAPQAGQQTDQMAQAPAGRSFNETYGEDYAQWGDRTVDEMIGTQVVNDAGETIGEVDDFGLAGEQLVVIVGIGGFLGLGEHQVAVPIDQLNTQGEQLLLAGVTREQLEAMPEYDEGEAQTFAADQTLRGGFEGTSPQGTTDTAAVTPSEDPANDQPMEDVGEEMAQATEEATETADQAGQEMAEGAGQATESVTGEAGGDTEMAQTDDAIAPTTEETETAQSQPTDQQAAEGTEMAETEQPMATEETETAQVTEQPAGADTQMAEAESDTGWTEEMDSIFADIADRQIAELVGMDIASAEGEVVGQVDNFALQGQEVVAIVGVGGFLGIGEHDVALPLGDLTYDGERLVLSSMTEDQLREMPEYEGEEANRLSDDQTLRSTYNQ